MNRLDISEENINKPKNIAIENVQSITCKKKKKTEKTESHQ